MRLGGKSIATVFLCLIRMKRACFLLLLVWIITACDGNGAPASTATLASPAAPGIPPTVRPTDVREACVLGRDQVPSRVGAINTGYINSEPVDVKFALEGPWNFAQGPSSDLMQRQVVALGTVKDATQFPGADMAVRVTSSLFDAGGEEFEFYQSAGAIEREMGVSFSWSIQPTVYEPPYRTRMFPIKAGDSWKDTYRLKSSDGVTLVQATYEALACGTLSVPAGMYGGTMLIRSTLHGLSDQGRPWSVFTYYWLSPGVGESAWITSQVNEQQRLFRRASNFFRLKESK